MHATTGDKGNELYKDGEKPKQRSIRFVESAFLLLLINKILNSDFTLALFLHVQSNFNFGTMKIVHKNTKNSCTKIYLQYFFPVQLQCALKRRKNTVVLYLLVWREFAQALQCSLSTATASRQADLLRNVRRAQFNQAVSQSGRLAAIQTRAAEAQFQWARKTPSNSDVFSELCSSVLFQYQFFCTPTSQSFLFEKLEAMDCIYNVLCRSCDFHIGVSFFRSQNWALPTNEDS